MNTKIFCDIAQLDLIKKFNKKKNSEGFYYKSHSNEKSWSKRLQILFKKNSKNL